MGCCSYKVIALLVENQIHISLPVAHPIPEINAERVTVPVIGIILCPR